MALLIFVTILGIELYLPVPESGIVCMFVYAEYTMNCSDSSTDSSTRLIWVSSMKWCHEWLGNFSYLSTKTFDMKSDHIRRVSYSAWHALSLPKSVYLVYPTPWDSLVCGSTPQVYFWFLVTRVIYPRCIIV